MAKFTAESNSERILKIGQHLSTNEYRIFMAHSVFSFVDSVRDYDRPTDDTDCSTDSLNIAASVLSFVKTSNSIGS